MKPYTGQMEPMPPAPEPGLMVALTVDPEADEVGICLQVWSDRVLLSPEIARQVAASLMAVAEHAEKGEPPEFSMFVPETASTEEISRTTRWNRTVLGGG